jgi:hypothetical protein
MKLKPVSQNLLASSTLQGQGLPLPPSIRSKMEATFAADFSDVRIHADSQAPTMLNALAFTQGSNVHFAPNRYQPHDPQGLELLGHELTHVVQQRQGHNNVNVPLGMVAVDDAALEREADVIGNVAQR